MEEKMLEERDWVGRQLGKYKILKLLGCGGMGAVYQALNVPLDKIVCLKILFPVLGRSGSRSVERFLREAKSIARLGHQNIVRIYDIEEEQGTYFIVMEYIAGKTLSQLLEERDAFGLRETVNIGLQIADALAAAHKQNVIHRDIKPANIMIEGDYVKLTDFGLARFLDTADNQTYSNDIMGTPLYIAPESIKSEILDRRVDLYSMGITLFHMLSGEPPYTGNNSVHILQQHLYGPVPSIRKIRTDVPEDLDAIITKLMAKNRDERFSRAEDVFQALMQCQAQLLEARKEETCKFSQDVIDQICEQGKTSDDKTEVEIVETQKIRVMIVDDSLTICQAISRVLRENSDFEVVGIANSGNEALDLIPKINPQVITLDFNMPEMDGITAVKQIMIRYPRPVIMLSGVMYDGALATFECLSYGAVDFICKACRSQQREFKRDLSEKIRNAARITLSVPNKPRITKSRGIQNRELAQIPAKWLAVMGADEGGYHVYFKTIPYILKNIPCAIIIVQEMPDELMDIFTNYLNQFSRLLVKQISDGEMLYEGVCYVANHMSSISIEASPENNGYRIAKNGKYSAVTEESAFGSILSSAASQYGTRAIGMALTGKNINALAGLKQVKNNGGIVVIQSPETCLRPEIASKAMEQSISDKVVADIDIPAVLWHLLKQKLQFSTTQDKINPSRYNNTKKMLVQSRGNTEKQYSLLVVGQEQEIQELVKEIMNRHRIIFVPNGLDAVFHLGKDTFDLIISEVSMSDLDGLKLLEIKKQKNIKTPFIFVTNETSPQHEITGLELGAVYYLRKPIIKELLLIHIKHVLGL